MSMQKDLFGNDVITDELLRDKFIEPPFSILDTKSGNWQRRKKMWLNKGIQSEIGRSASVIHMDTKAKENNSTEYTSIFDPALCEVLYHWFCPDNGKILDPFAGGSVRGIVANYLGYKYEGVDIRQEQVESNIQQAKEILEPNNYPKWYVGDSQYVLHIGNNEYEPFYNREESFDFVFSCPPYGDLEKYSDMDGDLSNMTYTDFLIAYEEIIKNCFYLLKRDRYACFVVGEFRDKKGNYVGFVPDTIKIFQKCGFDFYNEAILITPIASASMRANGNMKSQKLVKVHQNILVFKKQ